MTPELVFQLASTVAIIAWLILATALVVQPGSTRRLLLLLGGRFAPALLCVTYLALLVTYWGSSPGGGFSSLEGVVRLFSSQGKLLGGWVHYLAFDLFVGRWMIDDTLAAKGSRWILLPCLATTFLYGPAGLLLYFAVRVCGSWTQSARPEQ
jgi:Domain of unknown function (DUF4281)